MPPSKHHHRHHHDDHVDVIPDIYFEVDGDSGRTWHIIKSSSSSSGSLSMKLVNSNIPKFPENTSYSEAVAIGSTIFVSGGMYQQPEIFTRYKSNKVFYVDAHDPHPQWREAPPMIYDRGGHYSFAYDGKIYVLSGYANDTPPDDDGNVLYAEVYDPKNPGQGWKELARLQSDIKYLVKVLSHAVVRHGSDINILLHAAMTNYIHGIRLGSPYVVDTDSLFTHSAFASAYVDGVFYYVDYKDIEQLYAFNLNEPWRGPKRVKFINEKKKGCLPYHYVDGPWDRSPLYPTACLLSLGNKNLAVIWAHDCLEPCGMSLRVYCSILKVSKKRDNCFEAKVLGYSNYITREGTLACCLPVLPRRKDAVLRLPRSEDVLKLPRRKNVGQITESSNKQRKHLKKRTREEGVKRGGQEKRRSGMTDGEKSPHSL